MSRTPWAAGPLLLDALFMGMELCWVAAGLLLANSGVTPAGQPNLAWTAAGYPAAYLLSRGLNRRGAARGWEFFWAALGLALGLTVGLKLLLLSGSPWAQAPDLAWPRVFWLLLGGGFCWARGWLLGQRRVDVAGFSTGLQVGLVLLVGAMLLAGLLEIPMGIARLLIIAFFFCSLAGLWLARVQAPRAGPPARVRGAWLGVVLACLGLVLALGLLLGGLMDRSILELLLKPILWLWDTLLAFLAWLAGLFASDQPPPPLPVMPTGPLPSGEMREAYRSWFDLFDWLRPVAEVIFVGLWVGALGTILLQNLLRLARWLGRRGRSDQAEYESLPTDWLSGVRSALRRLAYLLTMPWRLARGLLRGRGQRLGRGEAMARRIYSRFLLWAAARGSARRPDQTPREFLAGMRHRLPEHGPDLEALTLGYERVRYGPVGTDDRLTQNMTRAWQRLKKARMLKNRETRGS